MQHLQSKQQHALKQSSQDIRHHYYKVTHDMI